MIALFILVGLVGTSAVVWLLFSDNRPDSPGPQAEGVSEGGAQAEARWHQAERTMRVLSAALQNYAAGHSGELPDTLDGVKSYVVGSLTDPFSKAPYIYRHEGRVYLLTSYGADQKRGGDSNPNADIHVKGCVYGRREALINPESYTWSNAYAQMRCIKQMLDLEHEVTGKYPASLEFILSYEGTRPDWKDPWTGKNVGYEATDKGYRLSSFGADRTPGGEGENKDIVFTDQR